MNINGKKITSGTIVIAPGETAELVLPFVSAKIEFDSSDPGAVSFNSLPYPRFVFGGPGNPLGSASSMTIPLQNGTQVKLNFACYTIGNENQSFRVLHYTIL